MPNNNLTDAENIRILEETIEYNNRVGRPTATMNIYTLEIFLDLINRLQAEKAVLNRKLTDAYLTIDKLRGD